MIHQIWLQLLFNHFHTIQICLGRRKNLGKDIEVVIFSFEIHHSISLFHSDIEQFWQGLFVQGNANQFLFYESTTKSKSKGLRY